MCIAIYCRVSTERQIMDGFGLDVQRDELINEVNLRKLEYKEYTDYGITGTSIVKRNGLQNLLQDVSKGEINEVWVTKLSRLGRNTRDVLNIIHEFEMNNVVFKSLRDGIDTSNNMGKIMLQFMSIVSEMERDIIIETTKAGLDYRASLGKIYGCQPVLGYDRFGSGKNSYLEINRTEARIVKLIYNLYLKGYGYKAITNELNGKGFRTKRNNYFSINTVKNILSNPLYSGRIRYNLFRDWSKKRRKGLQSKDDIILVDGLHKNIISKVKWEKVQKVMSTYKTNHKIESPNYLLSGIVKCPDCGNSMVGIKGMYKSKSGIKTYRYYVCSNYHNKGKHACESNSVNADKLDELIYSYLENVLSHAYKEYNLDIIMNILEVNYENDPIKTKKFMKLFISDLVFDFTNNKIIHVRFNTGQSLFEFLNIKYSISKEKVLKDTLDSVFDIIN